MHGFLAPHDGTYNHVQGSLSTQRESRGSKATKTVSGLPAMGQRHANPNIQSSLAQANTQSATEADSEYFKQDSKG